MGSNRYNVMESNGIISFDLNGKTWTLCFGMKSLEVFGQRLTDSAGVSNVEWFTNIIYSGIINEQYLNREPYITFREAGLLADEIMSGGDDLQNRIMACYDESKASKRLVESLNSLIATTEKKSEVSQATLDKISKVKKSQSTGTKSKSRHRKTA